MINNNNIDEVVKILGNKVKEYKTPIVTKITNEGKNPFKILISTIISLRTKDDVTEAGTNRIFELATTPKEMAKISIKAVEKAIYPAGFYKTKAKTIIDTCNILVKQHNSIVPDDLDELLKIKGIGRKTANLVIGQGYDKPAICVDTHVHRISNRFGYVKTKNPHDTEFALRDILPLKYWIIYNDILVAYGQNLCVPISPKCSICPIEKLCPKIDVKKSR
jgi:endonuclease III